MIFYLFHWLKFIISQHFWKILNLSYISIVFSLLNHLDLTFYNHSIIFLFNFYLFHLFLHLNSFSLYYLSLFFFCLDLLLIMFLVLNITLPLFLKVMPFIVYWQWITGQFFIINSLKIERIFSMNQLWTDLYYKLYF